MCLKKQHLTSVNELDGVSSCLLSLLNAPDMGICPPGWETIMQASTPFKWFKWSEPCRLSYQSDKWVSTLERVPWLQASSLVDQKKRSRALLSSGDKTHTHRRPGVCIRGAVALPSSLMPKVKPGVDPNPNLKSSQMGRGKPKLEAQAHLILMF